MALRDSLIPLPTAENDDYRRVLLLGTTGAGKTTLVRQLIGTEPRERFPSISTAKTTVHDMEIVLDDGPYRAVVTFLPREELQEYLNECVSAAILSAWRRADDAETLARLLTHVSQRFRLNYILGNGPSFGPDLFDDDDDEGGQGEFEPNEEVDYEDLPDLEETNQLLFKVVQEIRGLTAQYGEQLRRDLGAEDEKDQRVIDEIFEDGLDNLLRTDESFHALTDGLVDEVAKRFELLTVGQVSRNKQGWPRSWSVELADRDSFLKAVSRFSSNHAQRFGSLLTPMVNGVRVAGPFLPTWAKGRQPKFVLLDGEGLGHSPKSAGAVSTSVTRRIEEANAVVLVDSAAQPMQAAPVAAMKELVSTGNASKLLFAFTHFDEVKGDNLPTTSSKARHVLASAENVLSAVGEELGPYAERALRGRMDKACVFLEKIQEPLSIGTKTGRRTIRQLLGLVQALERVIERPEPTEARPVYDRMNLVLAVKSAVEGFHESWSARLGIEQRADTKKEHWTRIKALSRRLAMRWSDEYDTLMPVADLKTDLQGRIYVFLQSPLEWIGPAPSEDEKQQFYDALAENVSRRMLDLATRRISGQRVREWQDAYDKRGVGSTFDRARIIAADVYQQAAPVPDMVPSRARNQFLHEVSAELEGAAEETGAQLI